MNYQVTYLPNVKATLLFCSLLIFISYHIFWKVSICYIRGIMLNEIHLHVLSFRCLTVCRKIGWFFRNWWFHGYNTSQDRNCQICPAESLINLNDLQQLACILKYIMLFLSDLQSFSWKPSWRSYGSALVCNKLLFSFCF